MKYMTFNSSCPYAGLANMLSYYGLETDDRTIALDMGLPYFFAWEDEMFLAGPSLQSAPWFNLYLNPRGFALEEVSITRNEVTAYLKDQERAMLGLQLEGAPKHAFVYTGTEEGKLCFLNNKWAHDPAPETLTLAEDELLDLLDETCTIATLKRTAHTAVPIQEQMTASLVILEEYRRTLDHTASRTYPVSMLRQMLNTTFRALLLDGITMLDLLGQEKLHAKAVQAQRLLLTALRSDAAEIRLADQLPLALLNEIIDDYKALIQDAIPLI